MPRLPNAKVAIADDERHFREAPFDILSVQPRSFAAKVRAGKHITAAVYRASMGQGDIAPENSDAVLDEFVRHLAEADSMSRQSQADNPPKSESVQTILYGVLTHPVQTFAAPFTVRPGTPLPKEIGASVGRAGKRPQHLIRNTYVTTNLQRTGQLASTPVSVDKLIHFALETLGPDSRRVRTFVEDHITVVCNSEMTVKALVLLLDNAFSFSRPDAIVDISCVTHEAVVEIELRDRGAGVQLDDRKRIFELLTQADSSDSRSHQGIGVGLGLVRLIMEAQGGQAGFREADGGGSIFFLRFPTALKRGECR